MGLAEDIAALERALATGEKRVEYQDRVVQMHDMDQILMALNELKRQEDIAQGGSKWQTRMHGSKGLRSTVVIS